MDARCNIIQPQKVSYVPVNLTEPINGPYIVTPTSHRKVLLSNVYGEGESLTLKVVNDSDSYITFKKDKAVGLAEAISNTEGHVAYLSKMQPLQTSQSDCSKLPAHLQTMYDNNISSLSQEQQKASKNLVRISRCVSRDEFYFGCMKGGI